IATGHASGESALGLLTLERIGGGSTTVLLATLGDAGGSREARAEHAPEQAEHAEARTETEPSSRSERRAPLRFVWTMDVGLRFQLAAPAFADAMGPRTAALIGEPWSEIAAALGIDRDGRVASAVASRDTFSGIVIAWPAEATAETVPVELSGLPIFDLERNFTGYRGFGLCRDVARATPAEQKQATRPQLSIVPASKNVVPFRGATADKRPTLTPVERSAFNEIAAALATGEAAPAAPEPVAQEPAAQEPTPAPESDIADHAPMPSAFATGAGNDTA